MWDIDGTLILTGGAGGNAMIGIAYISAQDAEQIRKRVTELCDNRRYDGAFWETALYDKDRMIVYAKVPCSSDVVEINTYEQLRELDEGS